MGLYINETPRGRLPAQQKAKYLPQFVPGTVQILPPKSEADFQENMVCVVENGMFDAAAYAFSPSEMMQFAGPDSRRRTWFIVPGAKELAK